MSTTFKQNNPPQADEFSPHSATPALLTVNDAIGTSPNGSLGLTSTAGAALDILKNILDGMDTLPCVKYVAGVGVKILEIVDEVQSNKDALKSIALRAKDVVVAVAQASRGLQGDTAKQLESDLQHLTGTMNEILTFVGELASRSGFKKVFHKAEDSDTIKSLNEHLTHAFHIFTIQSFVGVRIWQLQQSSPATVNSRPPLVQDRPLRVPEGVYLIRNALYGYVIESEHLKAPKKQRRSAHIYVVPSRDGSSPYQLWTIFQRRGEDSEYTIRNFATGAVLDVNCSSPEDGTQVIGYSAFGSPNQTWTIYGSRQSTSFDYCTIRSCGPPTVLDTRCTAVSRCDYLHASHLHPDRPPASQEWSLVRFPLPIPPPRSSLKPESSQYELMDTLPRRQFRLQNVMTRGYMSITGPQNGRGGPNVGVKTDAASSTPWRFIYVTKDPGAPRIDDFFALVTGPPSSMSTLAHINKAHVAANSRQSKPHQGENMWKAIPRDGVFTFRSMDSGKLLSFSRATQFVEAASPSSYDSTACQWRLIDAVSGDICRVLYDSTVSIIPPEMSGPPAEPQATQQPTLSTEAASSNLAENFLDSLRNEHDRMRGMLKSECTSLVVAPLVVTGWSNGRICTVSMEDEESVFGVSKQFRSRGEMGVCGKSK